MIGRALHTNSKTYKCHWDNQFFVRARTTLWTVYVCKKALFPAGLYNLTYDMLAVFEFALKKKKKSKKEWNLFRLPERLIAYSAVPSPQFWPESKALYIRLISSHLISVTILGRLLHLWRRAVKPTSGLPLLPLGQTPTKCDLHQYTLKPSRYG